MENGLAVFHKLTHTPLLWPMYLRNLQKKCVNTYLQKALYTDIQGGLVMVAQSWKQLKCPSAVDGTNRSAIPVLTMTTDQPMKHRPTGEPCRQNFE